MKRFISILTIISVILSLMGNIWYAENMCSRKYSNDVCKVIQVASDYNQADIPVILVPWILASWYSESGRDDYKKRQWIVDPITHIYDPLIHTLQEQWQYTAVPVSYTSENTVEVKEERTDKMLYVFWYDSKRDVRITATMLNYLVWEVASRSTSKKVNIIAHSMWGIVSRAFLEDMCVNTTFSNWKVNIKYQNNYLDTNFNWWQIKEAELLWSCSNSTKINNLITVWTPQYWSPKAYLPWVYWDMATVFWWKTSAVLNSQLHDSVNPHSVNSDYKDWIVLWENWTFYDIFHWLNKDSKVKNWVLGLWELIPDRVNLPVDYLKIKETNNNKITSFTYPTNPVLSKLNSKDWINKMFSKLTTWKYYMFYWTNSTKSNDKIEDKNIENITIYSNNINSSFDLFQKWTGYDQYYNIYKPIIATTDEGDWTVPLKYADLQTNSNKIEKIKLDCLDQLILEKDRDYCKHSYLTITSSNEIISILQNKNYKGKKTSDVISYIESNNQLGTYNYTRHKDWHFFNTGINPDQITMIDQKNNKKDGIYNTEYWTWAKVDDVTDLVGVKDQRNSWITLYDIYSPINLVIEDKLGRKIWVDPSTGEIFNEIPWAWTSWDTWDEWQPKVFMIPSSVGDVHQVVANSTGSGQYHIVVSNLTSTDTWSSQPIIISGSITPAVQDAFKVDISSTWFSYVDTNNNILPGIDIINHSTEETSFNLINDLDSTNINNVIETTSNKINLEYLITGNHKNVKQIQLSLFKFEDWEPISLTGWILDSTWTLDINWNIPVDIKYLWNYRVHLDLIGTNWEILPVSDTSKSNLIVKSIIKSAIEPWENNSGSINNNSIGSSGNNTIISENIDAIKNYIASNTESLAINNHSFSWVDVLTKLPYISQDISVIHIPFSYSYNPQLNINNTILGKNFRTNFESIFNYDEITKEIQIILPDWESAKFTKNNTITSSWSYSIVSWTGITIQDISLDEVKIINTNKDEYTFSKWQKTLQKVQYYIPELKSLSPEISLKQEKIKTASWFIFRPSFIYIWNDKKDYLKLEYSKEWLLEQVKFNNWVLCKFKYNWGKLSQSLFQNILKSYFYDSNENLIEIRSNSESLKLEYLDTTITKFSVNKDNSNRSYSFSGNTNLYYETTENKLKPEVQQSSSWYTLTSTGTISFTWSNEVLNKYIPFSLSSTKDSNDNKIESKYKTISLENTYINKISTIQKDLFLYLLKKWTGISKEKSYYILSK